MTSVVVTDVQVDASTHELTAQVPAAKYVEICTTLGCAPGEVAATLLQRVSDETDARFMSGIMLKLREVKAAGKLGQLASMFDEGGSLYTLTQP